MRTVPFVVAAVGLLAACSSRVDNASTAEAGGTVVFAATEPGTLFPPLNTSTLDQQIDEQIFDFLATIGPSLNTIGDKDFTPRLATSWDWAPDSLSIAFHLDPRARWHDGAPVRAEDVRFTFQVFKAPDVGSPVLSRLDGIDSASVRDSLTAVVWFRRKYPEQFNDAANLALILPSHLLKDVPFKDFRSHAFGRNPVGSGRFRFVRWDAGATVELIADTANYRGRAKLDRVIWTISPDYTTSATKLFAGEADYFELLRPEGIEELARHPELTVIPYPTLNYAFVAFNFRDPQDLKKPNPLFADIRMRRAISMAVDRTTLVRSTFDSLASVAIGPVPRALPGTDTTLRQIPYDPPRAQALLDSLGWRDTNGDGIRDKGGRPLAFSLIVPNSSRNRVRMAVLLQEQLKLAGVRVDLENMEFNAFSDRQMAGKFDAMFGAWNLDPSPGGIRQTWGSAAIPGAPGGGFNSGSYVSRTFDALIDTATVLYDPAKAQTYFTRAYQTVVDDAPAIWMYEFRNVAGAHKRIHVTNLRADTWWAGLADWTIPPAERIPRDNIGLRPAP